MPSIITRKQGKVTNITTPGGKVLSKQQRDRWIALATPGRRAAFVKSVDGTHTAAAAKAVATKHRTGAGIEAGRKAAETLRLKRAAAAEVVESA